MSVGRGYDFFFLDSRSVKKLSNNVVTVIASGLNCNLTGEGGLCIDKYNNVWVASTSQNLVYKVTQGGVVTSIAVTSPWGMCCDKNNNIWVCNKTGFCVHKIVGTSIAATIAVDGTPYGICCDMNNNIWVGCSVVGDTADYVMSHQGNVFKISNNTVVATTTIAGSSGQALCCDLDNNIWIAEYTAAYNSVPHGGIGRIDQNGAYTSIETYYHCGVDICIDGLNNVWVVDIDWIFYGRPYLYKVTNKTSTQYVELQGKDGYCSCGGLSTDNDNNVFVTDNLRLNVVQKLSNSGTVLQQSVTLSSPETFGDSTGRQWDLLFGNQPSGMPYVI